MAQDATITLTDFNDSSKWEHVDYNLPIFVEHELWEVPHPWLKKKTVKIAVLPGDPKPEKGTMLYRIGAEDLEKTAGRINANLEGNQTPVGIFIGHRDPSKPEKEQPQVVGYGVGAKMGTFGTKNIKAVLADKVCYLKGHYSEAKTYPFRSPEFQPLSGNLTGLALLRNDPKLPMGAMSYSSAKATVYYGPDFMKDKKGDEGNEGESNKPPKSATEKGAEQDPTKPPDAQEPDAELYQEWMIHFKKCVREVPEMLNLFKDYEAKAAGAINQQPEENEEGLEGEIGDDPEAKPNDKSKSKKPDQEGKINMSQEADVLAIDYKAEFTKLTESIKPLLDLPAKVDALVQVNAGLTQKYAASEAKRIVAGLRNEGYQIKNPAKLTEKLIATDDAGRKALVEDVRENYAQVTLRRDPATVQDMGISDEPAEGTDKVVDNTFGAEENGADMTAAVKYAEEHKLSLEDDWDKIVAAVAKK